MLAAYYTKGYDSHELFDSLKIAQTNGYEKYMNKYNVIYIDFSILPEPCDSYQEYISWIKIALINDLQMIYHIKHIDNAPISHTLNQTNDSFIFVLDEWDSIFYKDFMSEKDKIDFLQFLKGLLKDQPYVNLVYMIGVLPIAKYSSGSELNMFREFHFMNDSIYDEYFGFTEEEVKQLCQTYTKPTFEELQYWYNGYYLSNGRKLFNPRSVNNALNDGVCRNYRTETGPMNEIADYIEHNVDEVREDIVNLVAGNAVKIRLNGYGVTQLQLDTREEKSGKGYVDYLFIPRRKEYPAIILELKYKSSASVALQQMKEKNYIDRVKDYHEVLYVGINYDGNKHHECIIEKVINKV